MVMLLAAIAGGCVTRQVQALPSELRAHATELRTTGKATVQSIDDGRFVVDAATTVEVKVPADAGAILTRQVTIGELVGSCTAPGMPTPQCLADQVLDREIIVGEKPRRRVGTAIASGVSVVAGLAVAGVCLVECDNNDIAIGAGLVVAGVGILVLGLMLR